MTLRCGLSIEIVGVVQKKSKHLVLLQLCQKTWCFCWFLDFVDPDHHTSGDERAFAIAES